MTFTPGYPYYTGSGQLSFRTDANAATGAYLPDVLDGKRSFLKRSLPTILDYLMPGAALPELISAGYLQSLETTLGTWNMMFKELPGTNVDAPGSPGMISVLPKDRIQYTMYEDEVPEFTRITTGATSNFVTGGVLNVYLSATTQQGYLPVQLLQYGDLLTNWSLAANSTGLRVARVVGIDTANSSIVVASYDGTTFSAETDFTTGFGVVTDQLEIIGNASDIEFQSALNTPSSMKKKPFRRVESTSNIKTYYTQKFEDLVEVPTVIDGPQRPFGGLMNPQATRNKLEAMMAHREKISRSLLWGRANANITSTATNPTFNGLNSSITTNITTLGDGALSIADIDEMLVDKLGGTHSSNVLYGFCSIKTLQMIESLFNSLASRSAGTFVKYNEGRYSMEMNVLRYRGFEVFLFPIADMMNSGARTFIDQTTSVGRVQAGSIFFVDPAAYHIVTGQHHERGVVLFNYEKNVELPEEKWYLQRHVLRSQLGFCLRHEKTSGVIKGVQYADLLG